MFVLRGVNDGRSCGAEVVDGNLVMVSKGAMILRGRALGRLSWRGMRSEACSFKSLDQHSTRVKALPRCLLNIEVRAFHVCIRRMK